MAEPRGKKQKTQSSKFQEAARELGCDESEAHFDAALKKVARHKPQKDSENGAPKSVAKPSKQDR